MSMHIYPSWAIHTPSLGEVNKISWPQLCPRKCADPVPSNKLNAIALTACLTMILAPCHQSDGLLKWWYPSFCLFIHSSIFCGMPPNTFMYLKESKCFVFGIIGKLFENHENGVYFMLISWKLSDCAVRLFVWVEFYIPLMRLAVLDI